MTLRCSLHLLTLANTTAKTATSQSFLKHKRLDTTRRYLHVVEVDDSEFGECIARMLDL